MRTQTMALSAVLMLISIANTLAMQLESKDMTLSNHVVACNEDGFALDLTKEDQPPFSSPEEYKAYVDNILALAEAYANSRRETEVRLLVHVHGGLNTQKHTVERLGGMVKEMLKEGIYPVLISWPSGALSTYGEATTRIRRGMKEIKLIGWSTAPFVAAIDFADSAVNAPQNWFYQGYNFKERNIGAGNGPDRLKSPLMEMADWKAGNLRVPNLHYSKFDSSLSEKVWTGLQTIAQAPVRASIGTLGQSSVAQVAWKNMKRRTSNMFYPAQMFDLESFKSGVTLNQIKQRASGYFFKLLSDRVKAAPSKGLSYRLSFVGHSMGTIVLNKLFTEYRHDYLNDNALREIVYMAAACSINDGLNALKPLLVERNRNGKPLHFYNLTLNRVAELAETPIYGIAPSGSLLEYIDQHLENPDTVLDRTLGSEVNVLASIDAFQEVWQFCDFKGFDRGPGTKPAAHGDFNDVPFWRPDFWSVNPPGRDPELKLPDGANAYPQQWLKQEQRLQKKF